MFNSRQLRIVAVFLALGPLIAYAAILPLSWLHIAMTRDDGFAAAAGAWFSGLRGLKDIYLVGLLPAALVTIAALLLSARKDAEFIIGSLVAGGLVAVLLTNLFGDRLSLPVDGPFGYAFVGAVAAAVCALLSRR